ncbi:hypothetical protein EYF80_055007 [Liparis tanakae]|uniref:Uncharacterized protein n=1 Tax=Liparis tanakae TaxID=230148 RepID=A0A4Z2F2C8_9TELE|nr:hypothetical protein EYF80_055007 [Liparis tanakae]
MQQEAQLPQAEHTPTGRREEEVRGGGARRRREEEALPEGGLEAPSGTPEVVESCDGPLESTRRAGPLRHASSDRKRVTSWSFEATARCEASRYVHVTPSGSIHRTRNQSNALWGRQRAPQR